MFDSWSLKKKEWKSIEWKRLEKNGEARGEG